MKSLNTINEVREYVKAAQLAGSKIGFVPTMGALHDGHLELIKASLQAGSITLASIFVNPTQFNKLQDLQEYPRNIDRDKKKLSDVGCHAVFIPSVDEIYPKNSNVNIQLGPITDELEGRYRPGHFNGVALIVSKLFNIVQPNIAFFGQKDIQQYHVIKKLRDELNFPIDLKMVSTKREANGLAMSSRNERLSESDKKEAGLIFHALKMAKTLLIENRNLQLVKSAVLELFKGSGRLHLEYFEVVRTTDFRPLDDIKSIEETVLCIAAEIGGVRLIDNLPLFS